jgi:ribosomal protein S18 acetylase RimI-like enzyme
MSHCRAYADGDYQFLREMLFEAVFWSREDDRPSLEEGLSYDDTRHILEDFGKRSGDLAVIAEKDGAKAGAAFLRYWNDDVHMRGYLSKEIPVLVIGVAAAHRRQGIGGELIKSLKAVAKDNHISKISLCVTKSNVAYRLYVNQNFRIVEDIGSSYQMLWSDLA